MEAGEDFFTPRSDQSENPRGPVSANIKRFQRLLAKGGQKQGVAESPQADKVISSTVLSQQSDS